MPELPEVETVRRSIAKNIEGKRITGVCVRHAGVLQHPKCDIAAFSQALENKTIKKISRRGKYLFFTFYEDEHYLVLHLRMTGKLLWLKEREVEHVHRHVILTLSDKSFLVYDDVRRFGGFSYYTPKEYACLCDRLGPEACDTAFSPEYLFLATRNRRIPIKSLLLNQSVVAGLGNIYVDEILFASGIRPKKSARRLSKKECAKIALSSQSILQEAIRAGGSSIRDYRDGSGKKGSFQLQHKVYGRANKPCMSCGTNLRSCLVSGRTSVYCPVCQKS